MKTAALIPAYNNESTVVEVVRRTMPHVDEVVVINDGSTDSTGKVVSDLIGSSRTQKIKLLSLQINGGKGNALKNGFRYALEKKFEVVVILDADMEHNPDEIPPLLRKIKNFDMIITQRNRYRSLLRKKLNRWATLWVRMLIPGIEDTQCGFRVLKTELLKKMTLVSNDFSIELEMILEAYRNNAKISFNPVKIKTAATSSVTLASYLSINDTFDRWFIRNHRTLSIGLFKKKIILMMSYLGLLSGFMVRTALKWIPIQCC